MIENGTVVAVLLCFLGAMLAIGGWAGRADRSGIGYFLAGRKLPYWVAAFSMNATGESAWLIIGLSGMAYLTGVQAFWIVAGETVGVALAWMLVAKRLNHESRERGSITVPDYLAAKVADKSNVIRVVAAGIILTMCATYIAAQILATGKAFTVFLDWDYSTGVWVGGLVTIAYTAFGGFKAVAYTDAAQASLMLFALVVIPVAGLDAVGGFSALWSDLRVTDPALLSPWAGSDSTSIGLIVIASAIAVGLPFIGVPQLLVRFMAIKDRREVPKAAIVSIVVILIFDAGAVATGLVGRALFPDLADAENIMPMLSESLFPPIVTGILVAAVLSAIMSTVSSLLNLASSAIVHDIYHSFRKSSAGSLREGSLGVWTTVVIGIAGCLIALRQDGLVFSLVLFAWSGLGAAFGPVVLCALHWRGTTREGVIAGMATGFSVNALWVIFAKARFHDLYEMIPAFAAGMVTTVVVSHLTKPRLPDVVDAETT